jgi:hypothetical protein
VGGWVGGVCVREWSSSVNGAWMEVQGVGVQLWWADGQGGGGAGCMDGGVRHGLGAVTCLLWWAG